MRDSVWWDRTMDGLKEKRSPQSWVFSLVVGGWLGLVKETDRDHELGLLDDFTVEWGGVRVASAVVSFWYLAGLCIHIVPPR